MGRFDFEKHGYSPDQVDKYINNLTLKYEGKLAEQKDRLVSLKSELDIANEALAEYKNKDKQISQALVMAVEKAEQIEDASKKIYGLEIKRVRLLYNRWEVLLEEIENRYPLVATTGKTKIMLKDFKKNIEEVLQQNNKLTTSVRDDIKSSTDNTYIKNILNRMDYVEDKPNVENKQEGIANTRKIIEDVQMKVVTNSKKPSNQTSVKSSTNTTTNKVANDKVPNSNGKSNVAFTPLTFKEIIIPKINTGKPKEEAKTKNTVKSSKEVETKKTYNVVDINSLIDQHDETNNRLNKFKVPQINKTDSGNIIDKYLNDNEDENNAYAKIITSKKKKKNEVFDFAFPEPNETGYDYKEALNPKEELDEIMKAFDFYNPDEEK